MSKKLTQKEVLERFKKVHGDKYDYSLVDYKGQGKKVIIVCRVHGDFPQVPISHWLGAGCPDCGIIQRKEKRKLGFDEFVERSNVLHGNFYGYEKVEYVNNVTNVIIICPKHGEFPQKPVKHLIGRGCPDCGKIKQSNSSRKTTEKFIEDSKLVHGDEYDYSPVKYVISTTKVKIICKKDGHGIFEQNPDSHSRGQGCPDCGLIQRKEKRKLGNDEFIERSNVKHNNLYGYEKVEYVNTNTHVIIICPLHGEFHKTPGKHLQGQGCPKCAVKNRKKPLYRKSTKPHNKISFEEFVRKSNLKYENKFSYSLKSEEFNLSDEDCLIVICEQHGEIQTTPRNHLYNNFVCEKCKYEDEDVKVMLHFTLILLTLLIK